MVLGLSVPTTIFELKWISYLDIILYMMTLENGLLYPPDYLMGLHHRSGHMQASDPVFYIVYGVTSMFIQNTLPCYDKNQS